MGVAMNENEVIARHSRSFSLATLLLPRSVAADVHKLYAWCRACDSAVDDAPEIDIARGQLDRLRQDVDLIYSGSQPRLPESLWLADLVERYPIPKAWTLDLLNGMESDLDFKAKRTVEDLEVYCYQAAGVVGLMMSRLLGVKDVRALEYAKSMGMAMQMTNIARDVAEDWARGRCYLPVEWFARTDMLETGVSNEELRPVLERLLNLADHHYRRSEMGYAALPSQVRWSIRAASAIYQEIGYVIRRSGFRVLQKRHYVPTYRKFFILLKTLAAEWRDRTFCPLVRPQTQTTYRLKTMRKDSLYLACFGLSLTLVMATAMFALVGINPKLESYYQLPWLYSAGCAIGAVVMAFLSKGLGRQMAASPARKPTDRP